ncbi:MAG: tail fiber domain-containing protein [Elusimicrobiota bacterium]
MKKDVETISGALEAVRRLRGVRFDWRTDEPAAMGYPEGRQVGLIGQEVEAVMPEIVRTGQDGYKSLDYSKMVPVLVEAIKEQQAQIDALLSDRTRDK